MSFFKKLFGKKKEEPLPEPDFSEEEFEKDYEEKQKGLEAILGEMHEMVGHSVIPFSLGGGVDLYYFRKHIPGTGFATMELLDPHGNGPKPNEIGTYELVAFTKELYNESDEEETAFNKIANRVCGIFTTIGNYSFEAVLNPNETCEIPNQKGEENISLVFDLYNPNDAVFMIGERKHHLLLCLEVFKSEMEYARENGSENLFDKLKNAGYYPYSDLDRMPVA